MLRQAELLFSILLCLGVAQARYPTGPPACTATEGCTVLVQNFDEPGVAVVYAFWCLCAVTWAALFVLKTCSIPANGEPAARIRPKLEHAFAEGALEADAGTVTPEDEESGDRSSGDVKGKKKKKKRSSSTSDDSSYASSSSYSEQQEEAVGTCNLTAQDFVYGSHLQDNNGRCITPGCPYGEPGMHPTGVRFGPGGHTPVTVDAADEVKKQALSTEGINATIDVAERCTLDTAMNARARYAPGTIVMVGYRDHWLGQFAYFLIWATSLHLIAILLVVYIDYYDGCQFKGVDNLCFYGTYYIFGSYDTNSEVLFGLWWMCFVWFGLLLTYADSLRNWCRLKCELSEAQHVWVWQKDAKEVMVTNVSFMLATIRSIKAYFVSDDIEYHEETVPVVHAVSPVPDEQGNFAEVTYIMFQCTRYVLYKGGFSKVYLEVGPTVQQIRDHIAGLSEEDAARRWDLVGPNHIAFRVDTIGESFKKEFASFFYLYQFLVYIVWLWFSYLVIALILILVVIGSGLINIYIVRDGQKAMLELTSYTTQVRVKRDGRWVSLSSEELVPGDLVMLPSGSPWVLPCDLVVIRSACIVDESGLTGESKPVRKAALPDDPASRHKAFRDIRGKSRHQLFAGTTLLQAGNSEETALAICTETGINTSKGDLVSAILYPQKMSFKYDEELPVVFLLLLIFGIVCFALAIDFQARSGSESSGITKWVYGVFTVSQILSPLLPVALVVGQFVAAKRLKDLGVSTLNPKRITISGKVRMFCFDKTGTLTKEGLDFLGVRLPSHKKLRDTPMDLDPPSDVVDALATCHAVSQFGDEIVGNQVAVKMFLHTGWTLLEAAGQKPKVRSPDGSRTLTIYRRFEFDHARRTMSVVILDESGRATIFCKGSAERIGDACKSKSLPKDYLEEAKLDAMNGCYVLGLARRDLGKVPKKQLDELTRDQVEQDLSFVGLINFRNEIKDDTAGAIAALKAGGVRGVMITGDNAQCGHYIAKSSGLIDADTSVLLGEIVGGEVLWDKMISTRDEYSNSNSDDGGPMNTQQVITNLDTLRKNYELAVTGKAYDFLCDRGFIEDLKLDIRIYARMTPENKVEVVKGYADSGLIVGMCGDGGNDCGALRAAHVGVALSEAEASVVSPFTSRTKSIVSCVDLLRLGRGALATSFGTYKFIISYGQLFSVLKLISFWYGVIMCMSAYVFLDAVAVITLSYAITLSQANLVLRPERPTSALLGPTTVLSIIGIQAINLAFLVGGIALMQADPNYVQWPASFASGAAWWTLGDNWETTVVFVFVIHQFMFSAVCFSFGAQFRRGFYYNIFLCVVWLALSLFATLLLLMPSNAVTREFHIASEDFNSANTTNPVWSAYQAAGNEPSKPMSFELRFKLWIMVISGLLLAAMWEGGVVQGPVGRSIVNCLPDWMRAHRVQLPRL